MSGSDPATVTRHLLALARGDRSVVAELVPLIYADLRTLAGGVFRGGGEQTLQPTALVHEAYIRLVGGEGGRYASRRHFLDVAAIAMRQLLTDRARRRGAEKRGGRRERIVLDEDEVGSDPSAVAVDLVDLSDALGKLEELDPRQARIVELRFLAGLSVAETAEVLGVATRTVELDWKMARAWLRRTLDETDSR